MVDGEQGDENRERSPGKNSEKTAGMVPGTIIPDGGEGSTKSPPWQQDEFIGFIQYGGCGFLFERSKGKGDREPGSGGKKSDKAAGMLPRTTMPTKSPPLALQQDELGFIHNGGGERSEGRGERTKLKETGTTIEDIWDDNVNDAFEEIEMAIHNAGTLFVGLDTEFCRKDGVLDPRGAPTSEQLHYDQVCRIVNEGDLLQIGIVLANELFETVPPRIFQFNLMFDQSSRSSDSKNLRFLRDVAKLNLDEHHHRGIPLSRFFSLMAGSGLISNNKLIWITYQGYCDFGYLIRGLQQVILLPKSRIAFLDTVQLYFPKSYDLKILHELGICCKPPPPMPRPKGTGGFQAMANGLGVDRIGEAHGAGSDAYLALSCYKTMVLSNPLAADLMSRFRDSVYGVAGACTLPWDDSNATEVEVCSSSFGRESKIFSELFCKCYQQVVSVEVRFVSGGHFNNGNAISYSMIRTEAALSGPVEIGFAISDIGGCLAFGRLWTFSVGIGEDRIKAAELAKMLMDHGVVLNPTDVLWCSSSSAAFAYLVKALSSDCLPPNLPAFLALTAAYFPRVRVLSMMLSENRPGRRALITLRQLLSQAPEEVWLPFCDLIE